MKKTVRKLQLNQEIIRTLSHRDLSQVAGGMINTTGVPCVDSTVPACLSDWTVLPTCMSGPTFGVTCPMR